MIELKKILILFGLILVNLTVTHSLYASPAKAIDTPPPIQRVDTPSANTVGNSHSNYGSTNQNPYAYASSPENATPVSSPQGHINIRINADAELSDQSHNVRKPVSLNKNVEDKALVTRSEPSKSSAPEITKPYKRPSGATTKEQRESVQGKPCVDCGNTTSKQYADHKEPLVKEYYRSGTIDKTKMREVDSVQPHCPTCSNKQGAELSQFSKKQKKDLGL